MVLGCVGPLGKPEDESQETVHKVPEFVFVLTLKAPIFQTSVNKEGENKGGDKGQWIFKGSKCRDSLSFLRRKRDGAVSNLGDVIFPGSLKLNGLINKQKIYYPIQLR